MQVGHSGWIGGSHSRALNWCSECSTGTGTGVHRSSLRRSQAGARATIVDGCATIPTVLGAIEPFEYRCERVDGLALHDVVRNPPAVALTLDVIADLIDRAEHEGG